jgi:cysteine synthase A
VDDAVQVVDRSVVQMAHWLLRNEGLFVGSSSALNIWAAAQVARNMSPGARVVTLACDGGQRYQSRLFDDSWLAAKDLAPTVQSLDQILETEPQSA